MSVTDGMSSTMHPAVETTIDTQTNRKTTRRANPSRPMSSCERPGETLSSALVPPRAHPLECAPPMAHSLATTDNELGAATPPATLGVLVFVLRYEDLCAAD